MAANEEKKEAKKNPPDVAKDKQQDSSAANQASKKTFPSSVRNIERILDINLELTVKIGELCMPLQEILNLHSGSIIEIDKNADAPLDLQIADKVLAQGEVVTVGENLGLRVIRK